MPDAPDEKSIFLAAIGLSAHEREEFLARACPDPSMRLRVRELLRFHFEPPVQVGIEPSADSELPFTHLGEYRLIRKIAEGGMGVVFLAHDARLDRKVAVKILPRSMLALEGSVTRFRQEARIAAQLSHPGIVSVYDAGKDGDCHYIVSEFVDGEPLSKQIAAERESRATGTNTLSLKKWRGDSVRIVADVAESLEACHREGFVHRDVKPGNILLSPGRGPRLTDFGIAKALESINQTITVDAMGTLQYMSPEQARGDGRLTDRRSDVFSLGVVLYELLTLRRPFDGVDGTRAAYEAKAPRLRAIDRTIPRDLETICHKALELRPDDRYQSALHMAADLRAFLDGRPILAAPPNLARRAWAWIREHRRSVAVAGVVGLAGVSALLAGVIQRIEREKLAWVSIETEVPGCSLAIRRLDPDTLLFEGEPDWKGVSPSGMLRLPTGQYRVAVVSLRGDDFVEIDLLLSRSGAGAATRAVIHGDGIVPRTWRESGDPHVLHATFPRSSLAPVVRMTAVPAGEYIIGIPQGATRYLRQRHVKLDAFFIDPVEVSNADYRAFVEATGHRPPPRWITYGFDEALCDRPMVEVTYDDVQAYARWRGARAVSLFEWQAAARDRAGFLYPWRGAFDEAPCDLGLSAEVYDAGRTRDEDEQYENYHRFTTEVFNDSPCGGMPWLLNCYGNVREMTSTPTPSLAEVLVADRCWSDPPKDHNFSTVTMYPVNAISLDLGFRCARSVQLPDKSH